jgi:SAM-dependent methyltransferase
MSEASCRTELTQNVLAQFHDRYRRGEWRDTIFRDLILQDIAGRQRPTILDIGCGRGFDGDVAVQSSLAAVALRFIGIEPDQSIALPDHFTSAYRHRFEDTEIDAKSIDIAYAIMVLEHLREPRTFFEKLHEVLVDGGVFWALTVDDRHWFCKCSRGFEVLRLKEAYLRLILGRRGEQRYENYPVFYRCNSPARIAHFSERFSQIQCFNFSRIGQCDFYLPKALRPAAAALDRWAIRHNAPGTLLAVRLQK